MTKRERGIAGVLQKFLKRNIEELNVFREEETSKQKTQRFRFFIYVSGGLSLMKHL